MYKLISSNTNHPFHFVDYSPWPLTGEIGAMTTVSGMIKWFHQYDFSLFFLGNIITILTVYQWWRDVSPEGTYQGLHTYAGTVGLRWGKIVFIVSEILFFGSFLEFFFMEVCLQQ